MPLPRCARRTILACSAALCGAMPATLVAQRLEVGARVRVRPPCETDTPCTPVIGQLQRLGADSIAVLDGAGVLHALTLTPTTRLDVSHGMRRRILEGAGVGLVAGVVVGALAVADCRSPIGDDSICGLYYVVIVPPGILLGAIVGAHLKTEWWLPPPERRLVIAPSPNGWQLGMQLAW